MSSAAHRRRHRTILRYLYPAARARDGAL